MRHLPVAEITFAAKSGFLSRSLWMDFFAMGTKSWRNSQWRALTSRGYFQRHPSSRAGDVIVPNRKSELVRRLAGDAVASAPFISQLDHDEICARIALLLERQGVIQSYLTEADQKRLFFGWNRSFLEAKSVKFPDLVLEVSGPKGKQTVAIEVELSRKSPRRYCDIFRAYRARPGHDLVVFLARANTIFDALSRAMKDVIYPTWERQVGFGSVDEWLKDPARALINLSEGSTTLAQLTAPRIVGTDAVH
jgi:hypothetical protein